MKKATITDVAKLANVSKSTVSQYLNERYDYMGEDTKKRIESAINVLGYEANYLARSLKMKRTSTIGVIVGNILHSFSTQVIRSIEDTCHEENIHVIVCNADDDPVKEKKYISMLRAKQVDGLIVFPTIANIDIYKKLEKDNYPLVFIDRLIEGTAVDSVLLDNEAAAKLAVSHLVEKGHERIGVITTSLDKKVTPRIERIDGYKKALRSYGITVNEEYIKAVALDNLSKEINKMMSLEEPPTALFSLNDLALMEVLRYAKDKDIEIPNEISLITLDDVPFADIHSPSLTTIKQPSFEMGEYAAKLLIKKINSEQGHQSFEIKRFLPSISIRKSCKKITK
ncbi:substrate-binding domain-containing protein [Ralstonia pickettii]|nr:substrate-binding domain-containing protein [Ralstonia pickettii]